MIEKKIGVFPKDEVETRVSQIKGKITSIDKGDNGLILLTLEDEDDRILRKVEFPFVENNLAFDTLNSCLLDKKVNYSNSYKHWCFTQTDIGSSKDYELEILEGSLKGKSYTAKRLS